MNIPTVEEVKKLIFFKIETATKYSSFEELEKIDPVLANDWANKTDYFLTPQEESQFEFLSDEEKKLLISSYYEKKANLYPEYGKVIAVSFGTFKPDLESKKIITYTGEETKIFEDSKKLFENDKYNLAGKGIKEFDVRFLCIRHLANNLPIPERFIQLLKAKPWEISFMDLEDIWKFGSYRPYKPRPTILSNVLSVPSMTTELKYEDINCLYHKGYAEEDIVKYSQETLRITMDSTLKIAQIQS